jgi:hypothetical protein
MIESIVPTLWSPCRSPVNGRGTFYPRPAVQKQAAKPMKMLDKQIAERKTELYKLDH